MKLSVLLLYFFFHIFRTVHDLPIFGGTNAEAKKYKHQVSLRQIDKMNQHFCGGSIISDLWILTAAHCVDNGRIQNDIQKILIVAGVTLLSEEGDRYSVKSFWLHENWDRKNISNDIGLLETTETIRFSSAVQPIPLASSDPPENTLTTLTGWGFTNVTFLHRIKTSFQ